MEERRAAVAQVLSYGIPFNREVRVAMAQHFGCSESQIRLDVRVAGAVTAADQLAPLSPTAAEKRSGSSASTYAKSA